MSSRVSKTSAKQWAADIKKISKYPSGLRGLTRAIDRVGKLAHFDYMAALFARYKFTCRDKLRTDEKGVTIFQEDVDNEDNVYIQLVNEFETRLNRNLLIRWYSHAIPNEAALDAIIDFSEGRVMEVGAGCGYWAFLLKQKGCDVICCDMAPPAEKLQWIPVEKCEGNEFVHNHEEENRTLMLCWPEDSDLYGYVGRKLIYIGEPIDGCTGDLVARYLPIIDSLERIKLPKYEGIRDDCFLITLEWA